MNNNYNDMAAKWWADTIQQNQLEPIKRLDFFKKELSSKIKSFSNYNLFQKMQGNSPEICKSCFFVV